MQKFDIFDMSRKTDAIMADEWRYSGQLDEIDYYVEDDDGTVIFSAIYILDEGMYKDVEIDLDTETEYY